LKQISAEIRCEKCAVILSTQYEDNGALKSVHHEGLIITVIDKAQNRFEFACPNCKHLMGCILTSNP